MLHFPGFSGIQDALGFLPTHGGPEFQGGYVAGDTGSAVREKLPEDFGIRLRGVELDEAGLSQ